MNTVIYKNGGNIYVGEFDLTTSQINKFKKEAKKEGVKGYITGRRYYNNKEDKVIVFFDKIPEDIHKEELKRRKNGLIGAKWYWL